MNAKTRLGNGGRSRSRELFLERLEARTMLASDWQNPFDRLDVDVSGLVTPMDALVVINHLVHRGSGPLPVPSEDFAPPPYLDVNGNNHLEPLDALTVINALNAEPMTEEAFIQKFLVDVETGEVRVAGSEAFADDGSEGESRFIGSTIVFNTSNLIDQPGNTGRKVINVSLTNRSGEKLGALPNGTVTGLRVLFGEFKNTSGPVSASESSTVSLFAGTGAAGGQDGPVGTASLATPLGVAVDNEGSVYVADSNSGKIRKITNGVVSTLAGGNGLGTIDGSGTAAAFFFPFGIARNPIDGSFVVTDFSAQRIRRVTPDGEVTTIAGTGAVGDANGAGNLATFRNPAGVAVDAQGTIYVAEASGNRIRKIVLTGSNPRLASNYTVSVLAGSTASPPVAGFADAVGAAARFNGPRGMAIDEDGILYVSEFANRRVRRITPNGEVATIAGTGANSNIDGRGDVASFISPQGVAVVPGTNTLLVSSSAGNTIRQLSLKPGATPSSATSWDVTTIAGTGVSGGTNGTGNVARFNSPIGLAIDASQTIYVADSGNNTIRRIVPTNGRFPLGNPTTVPPSEPVQLSNADGMIPVANPVLWSPTTPPVSTGQQPYKAYADAIEHGETTSTEAWSFTIPAGVTSFEFTVQVEANTSFLAPPAAVLNTIASGAGSPENIVRTIAGVAIPGFLDGSATVARFGSITGIAVDQLGNQYVADTGLNAIRRIGSDGRVTTIAGVDGIGAGSADGLGTSAQFNQPFGIAVTPDGTTLYVADALNHTIRRISLISGADPRLPASWIVSTIAGAAGESGFVDIVSGAQARFSVPTGLAIGLDGVVYVAEYSGNRIRRLTQTGPDPTQATSWRVWRVAGSASGETGNTDGEALSALFFGPTHIAVDLGGNIYVADSLNFRVRKVDPEGIVSTLAGSTAGYADGAGPGARFGTVNAIAVDSAGYVYVSDDFHRVRRISPTGLVRTVAGTSIGGDRDGTGDVAQLYDVSALAIDLSGALYVATSGVHQTPLGISVYSRGTRVKVIQRIFDDGVP